MGFRGFKGSFGDKGKSITAKDFKNCAEGWVQIGTKCFEVFNDTELMVHLKFIRFYELFFFI